MNANRITVRRVCVELYNQQYNGTSTYTTFSSLDNHMHSSIINQSQQKSSMRQALQNKPLQQKHVFYQIEVPHWECLKLGPLECWFATCESRGRLARLNRQTCETPVSIGSALHSWISFLWLLHVHLGLGQRWTIGKQTTKVKYIYIL